MATLIENNFSYQLSPIDQVTHKIAKPHNSHKRLAYEI